MLFKGKYEILGTKVAACDYDFLLTKINQSIKSKKGLLIFPTASHSLVYSVFSKEEKEALKRFDYVVPDSQWVRLSLGFLYGAWLPDRVYGPELTLRVCRLSQNKGYKIYLWGDEAKTLSKKLKKKFPKIKISRDYGQAQIAFVGLGSPRQEIFTSKTFYNKDIVAIPVGAAFDFISGKKPQAPYWMQKTGFEWFFRLIREPGRLWKRYLIYAPLFVFLVLYQKLLLGLKSGLR